MYGIVFLLLLIFGVTSRWIFFGLKLFFLKRRYHNNIGLLFLRSIGTNFTFPRIVPLDKQIKTDKKEIRTFTRDMFKDGTFWNIPFMFMDVDDMKTTLGIYKIQCDPQGNPLHYAINTPESLKTAYAQAHPESKEQDYGVITTRIPMLEPVKESVTVSPELLKTAFSAAALAGALEEFLRKYTWILYLAGAAALFAAIAAYLAFNNQNAISDLCANKFSELTRVVLNATTIIK